MVKKGQAAMEFLMTYGWAILVVLAAIAALAYFGVVDQSDRIPELCLFPAGMDCIDAAIVDAATDSATFVIINNKATTIEIVNMSDDVNDDCQGPVLTGCQGTGCTPGALPFSAANNAKIKLVVTCTGTDIVEGRFKVNPIIAYNNSNSGLVRVVEGQIVGKAS